MILAVSSRKGDSNAMDVGARGCTVRLGASAFIAAKLNNVYTDKKLISNKELRALQFIPMTFGFVSDRTSLWLRRTSQRFSV